MTKKILAVLCAAALLTGATGLQASAVDTVNNDTTAADHMAETDDTENSNATTTEEEEEADTIAKILVAAQEDENSYFSSNSNGTYVYLTANSFDVIETARLCYTIELEEGATLPEDAIETIGEMFTKLHPRTDEDGTVTIVDGEPEINQYGGTVNGVVLHTVDTDTYQLWFSPSEYSVDMNALATYLQTVPEFVSMTEDRYAYYVNDTGNHASINMGSPLLVTVAEGVELTTEDLTAAGIEGVALTAGQAENEYQIQLTEEEESTEGLYVSLLAQIKALQNVEKIESVGINYMITELAVDPEDVIVPHNPEAFFTRGDCDMDGSVTINDAYLALLEYASVSAGLESTLTGLEWIAADVDGSEKIEIMDAYYALLYYANISAGLHPIWSELTAIPEEPAVATDTTELTKDTTEEATDATEEG